ncbi:hypothetical protein HOY82DRAFT_506680 [Tuber indicum]|nr:hypothetical protein HOY82DRAFT_506680 [Tuber indicum]
MHPIKFLALLLPSVHAAVHLSTLTYEPFDVLTAPPFPWEELHSNPIPAETKMTLQIPLAYRDQDAYEKRVLTSQDPESPDYGKFIKPEELDLMLGPTDETFETVMEWLAMYGIQAEDTRLDRDWLTVETDVGTAEALLKAEYKWYVNRRNKDQVSLRCLEYSLPNEVRGMVRYVQPTTLFATRVGEREDSM